MKLKISFLIATLLISGIARADWEDDEDASRSAKVPASTRVRNYPGGSDEQDLKVQAELNMPLRSLDSPAKPQVAPGHTDEPDAAPND